MADLKFHEAAEIFPLMTETDFDELVEDIRKHGLREPGKLLGGKVLDGRNRYRACLQAGVKFRADEAETDDPIAYVISLNRHRRHLTPSQLSMVAAKARKYYDDQAKERLKTNKGGKHGGLPMENLPQAEKGSARDAAGKALGVSGKSVDHATKVLRNAVPEVVEAVEQGRMAVSTAAILATEPPELQRKEATTPKRNRKYTPGPNGAGKLEKNEPEEIDPVKRSKAVGIHRANEAVDALKRIPKNDPLRKRGFQIVTDWIKANR